MERIVQNLEKVSRPMGRWLNLVGVSLLPILVLLITADVIGRKFFNSPVRGTLEISELMTVVIVLFALAYTATAGAHVSMDLITSRLRPRAKAIVASLTGFIGLAVLCILVYGAIGEAITSRHSGAESMLLHIPTYPFRFVVALGVLALCLELLCQWLRNLGQARKKEGASSVLR